MCHLQTSEIEKKLCIAIGVPCNSCKNLGKILHGGCEHAPKTDKILLLGGNSKL